MSTSVQTHVKSWTEIVAWYAARPGEPNDLINPPKITVNAQSISIGRYNNRKVILQDSQIMGPNNILAITEQLLPNLIDNASLQRINASFLLLPKKWSLQATEAIQGPATLSGKRMRRYALWAEKHRFANFVFIILSLGVLWIVWKRGKAIVIQERQEIHEKNLIKQDLLQPAFSTRLKVVQAQIKQSLALANEKVFQEAEKLATSTPSSSSLPALPVITASQIKTSTLHDKFFSNHAAYAIIPTAPPTSLAPLKTWLVKLSSFIPAVFVDEDTPVTRKEIIKRFHTVIDKPDILKEPYDINTPLTCGANLSSNQLNRFLNCLRHIVLFFQSHEKTIINQKKQLDKQQLKQKIKELDTLLFDVLFERLCKAFLHCSDRVVNTARAIYYDVVVQNPNILKGFFGIKNLLLMQLLVKRRELLRFIIAKTVGPDLHQTCTENYYFFKFAKEFCLGEVDQEESVWTHHAKQGFEIQIEKAFKETHTAEYVLKTTLDLFNTGKLPTQLLHYWFCGKYRCTMQNLLDDNGLWRTEVIFSFLIHPENTLIQS